MHGRCRCPTAQQAAAARQLEKPRCLAADIVRKIQALLGHDKLETTARYTRVATGMISAVNSPLDDLGGRRRPRKKTGDGTS